MENYKYIYLQYGKLDIDVAQTNYISQYSFITYTTPG